MEIPEHISAEDAEQDEEQSVLQQTIAPVWHTAVLVVCILLISFAGSKALSAGHGAEDDRLQTYSQTAAMELMMVGWVWFGLWLRKIPFRALLGDIAGGARAIIIDCGIAMIFWIASLGVLGTIGILWNATEAAVEHHPITKLSKAQPGKLQHGKLLAPDDPAQQKTLRTLSTLAPSNEREVVAWILLCIFVGFAEEMVFRGYLQQQFASLFANWPRASSAAGVVFSALIFGAAHGYEGMRNMVMLAAFGALFSLLALFRRGLRAGMIAHGWHDLIAGLAIAFMKSKGFI